MDNICPTCNLNLRERTTCTVCECCGTAVPIGTCRTCGSRGHRNSGYGHRSGECWTCHEMHFHSARIAPTVPAGFGNTFSNNPNGKTGFMGAFNTKCSNCHNKVHGSDLPSQGVTGGGKALTR